MYYHYYEKGVHNVPRHYGARTDRFKIAYYYDLDEWELFDLHNDPREKNSVFDDPDYAAIRDGMLRLLEAERRTAGDDVGVREFGGSEVREFGGIRNG